MTTWPPAELLAVKDNWFNSLYLLNNKKNYKIFWWIDNKIVKMVPIVHTGCEGEDVEANRRRPRINPINKNNVAHVWWKEHRR